MLQYDRQSLGKHLKEIRAKANLSQGEVAKRLGYSSPQFISNIERGISVAPLNLLAKMTKLYKSDPKILAKIILKSQEQLLLSKLGADSRKKA